MLCLTEIGTHMCSHLNVINEQGQWHIFFYIRTKIRENLKYTLNGQKSLLKENV